MRTAAAIFFLALLVSIQTPAGQLLKFPLLVEHFMKHQKQEGVSLFGFLQDHYTTDHMDSDLPEDEQLPFKSLSFYNVGSAEVPGIVLPDVSVSLRADKKVIPPVTYVLQQHLARIFHPPRS